MCRMVVFSGTCTRCGDFFTWDELSQELSCLEAKNNGNFGECKRGIQMEEHSFDQDCDACAEEYMADEGFVDGGGEVAADNHTDKGKHRQQDTGVIEAAGDRRDERRNPNKRQRMF